MGSHRIAQVTLYLALGLVALTASVAAQTTDLTILVDNRPNYIAWTEAVVEAFEQEYPNINVEVMVPSGNMFQQLLVQIAGGTAPDLSLNDPHAVIDLARQGALVDLLPYVERDSDHFADWLPPALEMVRYGGGLYGLPRDLQVYGVYYNEDAYATSGLTPPHEDWTYAEFGDNARKLYLSDEQGNVTRHGSMLPGWRSWMIPVWAHGGDFVDNWRTPTQFTGRSDGVIAGLDYLRNLVESNAIMDRVTNSQWSPNNAFMVQRIAMYMQNSITIQAFRDIEDFSWNVAPLPVGPAGRVSAMNALNWFILDSSEHKNEAWTLLKYMTSPRALSMLVEMVGVVPPNRNVLMEEWSTSSEMPSDRRYFLTGIETARPTIGALNGSVYTPIGEEGQAVVWGEKPVTAALEIMEQRVSAAIAELGR